MELTLIMLLIFTPFAFIEPVHCDYKVCVNNREVISSESDIPCSVNLDNLDEICQLQLSAENTVISVNSTVLSTKLKFDDFTNLSIEGVLGTNVPTVTVTCQSNDSGLYFGRIQGLTIRNLAFVGCGALHNSTTTDLLSNGKNQTTKFKSTLYIWNSTDIKIMNVGIHWSNGLGMAIFDTNGTVIINDSMFKHNQMLTYKTDTSESIHLGGGGVYIEFTACPPGVLYGTCRTSHDYKSGSQYRIENSVFESNTASTLYPEKSSFVKLAGVKKVTNFQGLGRGGGLAIRILGSASNNTISIANCKFYHNQALSGGGLSIKIAGQASKNSIDIEDCKIVNNTSYQTGGGIDIGLRLDLIRNNEVMFKHCYIEENCAKTGGGTLLLLNNLGNCSSGQNSVVFVDCTWISNSAEYGAALDGIVYAPKGLEDNNITFKSCNFSNNRVIETQTDIVLGIQKLSGRGTFKVANMVVTFCHSVHFENNTGTALWAVASKIHFSCTMTGIFLSNFGINGGAISLISNSILFVHDNTALSFVENQASSKGGALFSHSVHENSFLMSASTCSVQYKGDASVESRNVSFSFERNLATLDSRNDANNGNSIYLTSLHACVFFCTLTTSAELTIKNFFSCVGEVDFQCGENCTKDIEVATPGHSFNVTVDDRNSTKLYATPGRVLELPVTVLDDLNNVVDSVYRAQIIHSTEVAIDPAYDYISNGKIKLYGPPHENGTLLIELAGLHEMSLTVNLSMLQCSPGYYVEYKQIQTSEKQKSVQYCTCNWKHSSVSAYRGIVCNQDDFTAYIIHGYWAGYVEYMISPQNFVTAYCPLHFCSYNNSNFKPSYVLPDQASLDIVDKYMCGPSRTGILCAECTHGYSVHYHSKQFECKPNRLCKLGWLFYILSELFPLTLIFVAIIVFNISFTSGALNGFIFFAQVVDSLALNAYDILDVYSPPTATVLTELYEFIYRIFNLEFFNINSLSFCLWEGARTMDMLTFKLVSILYGLFLILVTVLLIKKCGYHLKRSKMESYIIHGLTAFLVSCYIQCAQISFRILNPIYLDGVGSHSLNVKLVQYSGNIKYFSLDHLPYALPALVIISTIIALPPLYLIWYPVGRKFLSKCHLSELKGVQLVEKILMIDRMKPLLDSFQSSFKDDYRFFAGLYFLYRIFALTTFTLARTLPQFYIAVEIELVIIIGFHAAVQPYQKTWHNIVDAFIFLDIAIINALSIYIYIKATDLDQAAQESISTAIVIRLLLIYLPLIYVTSYLLILAVKQLRLRFSGRWFSRARERTITDSELPARLLYPDEYMPYENSSN